jgi:predicted nucleotide-binding protein
MISLSPEKLEDSNTVFIGHGRDEKFRKDLVSILRTKRLEPVVIHSMARNGGDLLGFLEEKIRDCLAGFILLTPEDEGRLYEFGQALRQRARQNVIFEAGYLTAWFRHTNRICFLQKGKMEILSDLHGLLMEIVKDGVIDPERIRLTLRKWGLSPSERPSHDTKIKAAEILAAEIMASSHAFLQSSTLP